MNLKSYQAFDGNRYHFGFMQQLVKLTRNGQCESLPSIALGNSVHCGIFLGLMLTTREGDVHGGGNPPFRCRSASKRGRGLHHTGDGSAYRGGGSLHLEVEGDLHLNEGLWSVCKLGLPPITAFYWYLVSITAVIGTHSTGIHSCCKSWL